MAEEPELRRQSEWVPLTKGQFRQRFLEKFNDPAYDEVSGELDRVFEVAWQAYIKYRKAPRTQPAGSGYADADLPLSVDWLRARAAIERAAATQRDTASPTRILIVNGSTRSEHSCPGEISKTRRLAQHALEVIARTPGHEADFLDLSALADEPWKVIHPCKACFSTSPALCHWPCSCYPNHALGQTNDWMEEIYARWTAAHGVMVLCPVHWYQAPASLKLMMDRLVCADGGNPDPTTTRGKDPRLAKALELGGWPYPKHLAGRAFAVVAHGDAAGPENLRRMLVDWLTDMGLVEAGPMAAVDTWIGWYKPYATSHQDLDAAPHIFTRVQNATHSLLAMVGQLRTGRYAPPDAGLREPMQK